MEVFKHQTKSYPTSMCVCCDTVESFQTLHHQNTHRASLSINQCHNGQVMGPAKNGLKEGGAGQ